MEEEPGHSSREKVNSNQRVHSGWDTLVFQKQTKGQWSKTHTRARMAVVSSTMESAGSQLSKTRSHLYLKMPLWILCGEYKENSIKNAKVWLMLFQKDYCAFSPPLRVYQMTGGTHSHSLFQSGWHISLRISQWSKVVFERRVCALTLQLTKEIQPLFGTV